MLLVFRILPSFLVSMSLLLCDCTINASWFGWGQPTTQKILRDVKAPNGTILAQALEKDGGVEIKLNDTNSGLFCDLFMEKLARSRWKVGTNKKSMCDNIKSGIENYMFLSCRQTACMNLNTQEDYKAILRDGEQVAADIVWYYFAQGLIKNTVSEEGGLLVIKLDPTTTEYTVLRLLVTAAERSKKKAFELKNDGTAIWAKVNEGMPGIYQWIGIPLTQVDRIYLASTPKPLTLSKEIKEKLSIEKVG